MPHSEAQHETFRATYFGELLDNLCDPVIVLDAEDRIAYANRQALLRVSPFGDVAIVGRPYSHELLFGPGCSLRSGDEALDSSLLPGTSSNYPTYGRQVVLERADAGRVHLRLDYVPIHSELGGMIGTGVVVHDATEEEARRAEAEWLRKELLDSHDSVEREVQATQLLIEAADTVTSWTQLGEISQGLADILVRATSHAYGWIGTFDSATGELVVIGSAGAEPKPCAGERWTLDDLSATTRDVIRGWQSSLTRNAAVHEERGILIGQYEGRGALLVPLLWRDAVIGLIVLDDPGAEGMFSRREIELVEAIAGQAAVAIENARLHEVEHGVTEALELQAAERQQWLSGISHDLRTPLAAIRGYAELLSTEDGLTEESRRQTRIILGQSKRIQSLISDMLLAFQIEGGQLPVDQQRTDLAEVLANVEEIVRTDPRFMDRDVRFESSGGAHYSRVDFSHFSRAVMNVVINALTHNPLDTSVVVELRQLGEDNEIVVVDDGDGIDDETLNRVWDRFARGISSSHDTDGVGLGMATTRHLVELMGGQIDIESAVCVGTRVSIRVPKDGL